MVLAKSKFRGLHLLVSLLCLFPLSSCEKPSDPEGDKQVTQRCREDLTNLCSIPCKGEEDFRYCYYNPEHADEEHFAIRAYCFAVLVGRSCEPCERLYTLNLGGSMREVSCENFYMAIDKRKIECPECVKAVKLPRLD